MAKQVCDNNKFTGIRLPSIVKPIHYDLNLKPNFNDFTFLGEVKIQYKSTEPTNNIVLHANEITITEGAFQDDSTSSPLDTVYYSKGTETATLEFKDNIAPSGTLHLKFNGILNDKMKGFYRTAYKIGESTVYAATTQFEATDARRCFPCWDEPAIKATFSVSLVIEKFMTVDGQKFERIALSNMNEIERNGPDEQVEIKFAKSPIMSTYLLAFVVGPFDYVENTEGRTPIRVYTTPGKKEQGRFALDFACKSLTFYEDYFEIKYPLPKMDLIAIPDFSSGAMENWGLVTYREVCLLVDSENTSSLRKQYVAIVVAHELAHQWFGNLVTMEWWTHLWLNEGFASFMESFCTHSILPEYDIWSQFVSETYDPALVLDSLNNSHPIEVPVNRAEEVDEIFDSISYCKGASVIRMLYNYIGDDSFRKGMKDYLTKFAYKNASTEDLWDCLEAASNKPLRRLMSGWTSQKGYPWLSLSCEPDGDKVKLHVTQNKFTADGSIPSGDSDSIWMIPISAVTGSDPTKAKEICLMEGKSSEIVIDGVSDSWFKLNPGTIGLYRTAYPEEIMSKLRPAISDQSLPPLDRFGVLNDFLALCQAGKVSTVQLLELLQAFKSETNYIVWSSINSSFARLSTVFMNTDFKEKYHSFGRAVFSEIFKKLTWSAQSGEKHTDAMTRSLVINRLVAFNDQSVIAEAQQRYKNQLENKELIAPDLRAAVYRAVATYGDDTAFESLFEIYRKSELQEEQSRVLRAVTFANGADRIDKIIKFVLSDEVRIQDKYLPISCFGSSNPPVAWKFLQDNKDFLREKYETGHLMTRLIKHSTENFASEEMAKEVSDFFEANKFPGAERTIQQSLESIRLNANWLTRDAESVKAFLSNAE